MPNDGLQELLMAVKNRLDMIIVRLDRHTYQEVGEHVYNEKHGTMKYLQYTKYL